MFDSDNNVQKHTRETGQAVTSVNANRQSTSNFTGGYASTPPQSKMSTGAVPEFPGIFPSSISTHASANFSGTGSSVSNEVDGRDVMEKSVNG